MASGVSQKIYEGRNSPGRHDVRRKRWQIFDSSTMKGNPSLGNSGGFDEKGVLARIGFNEVLVLDTQNGRHEAGEASAAPQVGPSLRP